MLSRAFTELPRLVSPAQGPATPIYCYPAPPHLSQDSEVWFMCSQCQHDEVSIQAIHDVFGVAVPARLAALFPDKCHGLVLTLTRNICIRQDDLGRGGGQEGATRQEARKRGLGRQTIILDENCNVSVVGRHAPSERGDCCQEA